MQLYEILEKKLGENINRKVLSSPYTYQIIKKIFFKQNNYRLETNKKITNIGIDQTAAAYQRRNSVAWNTVFFPGEIIHAFNLAPFPPEVASATSASLGMSPSLLNYSNHQLGFSNDSCSFHRCAIAGSLKEYFPIPDLLLASSHLCDGAPQMFKHLSRIYEKPFYLLDVPTIYRYQEDAEKYVEQQLKEITTALEKETESKLTFKQIEKVFENSNRARSALLKANKLRRENPCFLSANESLALVYLLFTGQGHPETPKILDTLVKELEEKKNTSAGQKEPRFRLIWSHLKPYYQNDLLDYIENELNVKIVFEEMNQVFWPPLNPKQPFLSLARKILSNPLHGSIDRRLDSLLNMTEYYDADAVIHFSHWGCRHSVGGTIHLKKELNKRGIPFLAIDGDCVDPGSYSKEQIRIRIESFVELLKDRKTS